MGIQASKRVGYNELRESIPGSLVPDQDFDLFYSLCKVESMRTISTVLNPNPNQLFFVVVSGEVHVQLTSPELKNQKAVTATIFTPGETIHFFNLPLKPGTVTNFDFGECVRNGDIKLALHFKTVNKSVARVIGIDRRSYDQFVVTARSNMHQLNSFLGLNILDIVAKSPFFKTITPDQVRDQPKSLRLRPPPSLPNFTPRLLFLKRCLSCKPARLPVCRPVCMCLYLTLLILCTSLLSLGGFTGVYIRPAVEGAAVTAGKDDQSVHRRDGAGHRHLAEAWLSAIGAAGPER